MPVLKSWRERQACVQTYGHARTHTHTRSQSVKPGAFPQAGWFYSFLPGNACWGRGPEAKFAVLAFFPRQPRKRLPTSPPLPLPSFQNGPCLSPLLNPPSSPKSACCHRRVSSLEEVISLPSVGQSTMGVREGGGDGNDTLYPAKAIIIRSYLICNESSREIRPLSFPVDPLPFRGHLWPARTVATSPELRSSKASKESPDNYLV